jgi:hypothetical protein
VKLRSYKLQLNGTKVKLKCREARIQKMIKTPYGYRSTLRPRKDLCHLAPKGGHAKRTMRLARALIAPTTSLKIQSQNLESGSHRRLCRSKESQIETGKALVNMLFITEVSAMCKSEKMAKVGIELTNSFMDKISESLGPEDIAETMDYNGITQDGWSAVFKQYKGAVRTANKGIRVCFPNPFQVSKVRQMLNLKLSEYVGEYYSLTESLEIPPIRNSKDKESIKVSLNENNSIFVDVEQVQCTMVELYGITPEGLINYLQ